MSGDVFDALTFLAAGFAAGAIFMALVLAGTGPPAWFREGEEEHRRFRDRLREDTRRVPPRGGFGTGTADGPCDLCRPPERDPR